MEQKPYHHGNLHNELIEIGIQLINEEGIDNFSLRKVARIAGVSPTACYNHFKNKEDLIASMKEYVSNRFADELKQVADEVKGKTRMTALGVAYVSFFRTNPHYLSFLYENEDYNITLTENDFVGDHKAFCIFREVAIEETNKWGLTKEMQLKCLISMWVMVQGIASMANMKGFHYDGDWDELTKTLLCNLHE